MVVKCIVQITPSVNFFPDNFVFVILINPFHIWLNTIDTDECSSVDLPCHSNATCSNIRESSQCTCNKGFSGNGESCKGTKYFHNINLIMILT